MSNHRQRGQRQSAMSYDTPMATAFLAALAGWVARHTNDPEATTMLPVGLASVSEVAAVLRGLHQARQQGE